MVLRIKGSGIGGSNMGWGLRVGLVGLLLKVLCSLEKSMDKGSSSLLKEPLMTAIFTRTTSTGMEYSCGRMDRNM